MFRWLQVWKDNETKKTKLIASQFKLLHRRLATNDFLRKIGIKDKGMRTFCEAELENLTHLVDNWQKLCNNTGYRPYLIHLNWFVTKGFHKPKKSISFFLIARYIHLDLLNEMDPQVRIFVFLYNLIYCQ